MGSHVLEWTRLLPSSSRLTSETNHPVCAKRFPTNMVLRVRAGPICDAKCRAEKRADIPRQGAVFGGNWESTFRKRFQGENWPSNPRVFERGHSRGGLIRPGEFGKGVWIGHFRHLMSFAALPAPCRRQGRVTDWRRHFENFTDSVRKHANLLASSVTLGRGRKRLASIAGCQASPQQSRRNHTPRVEWSTGTLAFG